MTEVGHAAEDSTSSTEDYGLDEDIFDGVDFDQLEKKALAASATQEVHFNDVNVLSSPEPTGLSGRAAKAAPEAHVDSRRDGELAARKSEGMRTGDDVTRLKEMATRLEAELKEAERRTLAKEGEASILRQRIHNQEAAHARELEDLRGRMARQREATLRDEQNMQSELDSLKVEAEFRRFSQSRASRDTGVTSQPVARPAGSVPGFGAKNSFLATSTSEHSERLSKRQKVTESLSRSVANVAPERPKLDIAEPSRLEIAGSILSCSLPGLGAKSCLQVLEDDMEMSQIAEGIRATILNATDMPLGQYVKLLSQTCIAASSKYQGSRCIVYSCLLRLVVNTHEIAVVLGQTEEPADLRPLLDRVNAVCLEAMPELIPGETLDGIFTSLERLSALLDCSSNALTSVMQRPLLLRLVKKEGEYCITALRLMDSLITGTCIGCFDSRNEEFGRQVEAYMLLLSEILMHTQEMHRYSAQQQAMRLAILEHFICILLKYGNRASEQNLSTLSAVSNGPALLASSHHIIPALVKTLFSSLTAIYTLPTMSKSNMAAETHSLVSCVRILYLITGDNLPTVLATYPGGLQHLLVASTARLSLGDMEFEQLSAQLGTQLAEEMTDLATELLERTVSVEEGDSIYDFLSDSHDRAIHTAATTADDHGDFDTI